MNAVKDQVRDLVGVELAAANEKFPQFHSPHEGWAVIREEVEETSEALGDLSLSMNAAWREIRANKSAGVRIAEVKAAAISMACEAIQVAAMAQKYLDMEKDRTVTMYFK